MVWKKVSGIGKLSREDFAKLVARTGVRKGAFEDPTVSLEPLSIADGRATLGLSNLYRTFVRLPRGERSVFMKIAILAPPTEVPKSFAAARDGLPCTAAWNRLVRDRTIYFPRFVRPLEEVD